jgi:hypothetical protein
VLANLEPITQQRDPAQFGWMSKHSRASGGGVRSRQIVCCISTTFSPRALNGGYTIL